MGYLDIKNREDIDGIIESTLSAYYGTTVRVVDKYAPNAFILNPRLNSAIFSKATKTVKKAVRRGYTARKSVLHWMIMQAYLRVAFSKRGFFGCKYITFENLPQNARYLYIMPGNMKIKLFDYKQKVLTNVIKEAFSIKSFEKELAVRKNPKWAFVPPIISYEKNKYTEEILDGCSFDRLKNSKKPAAFNEIKRVLFELQQSDRTDILGADYAKELLVKINELLDTLNCDNKEKDGILSFAQSVAEKCTNQTIMLAASHGDFQYGNLFVGDDNKIYVLDWETYGTRSIGYDILTFFYSFRYRRNFLERIDSFLQDENWEDISHKYYGKAQDKKNVLSVYFLEDILWLLQESTSTVEKRASDSLLKYADTKVCQEILGRL